MWTLPFLWAINLIGFCLKSILQSYFPLGTRPPIKISMYQLINVTNYNHLVVLSFVIQKILMFSIQILMCIQEFSSFHLCCLSCTKKYLLFSPERKISLIRSIWEKYWAYLLNRHKPLFQIWKHHFRCLYRGINKRNYVIRETALVHVIDVISIS